MDKKARKKKRMKINMSVYSGKPIGCKDAVLIEEAKDYLRSLGHLVSNKRFLIFFFTFILSVSLVVAFNFEQDDSYNFPLEETAQDCDCECFTKYFASLYDDDLSPVVVTGGIFSEVDNWIPSSKNILSSSDTGITLTDVYSSGFYLIEYDVSYSVDYYPIDVLFGIAINGNFLDSGQSLTHLYLDSDLISISGHTIEYIDADSFIQLFVYSEDNVNINIAKKNLEVVRLL